MPTSVHSLRYELVESTALINEQEAAGMVRADLLVSHFEQALGSAALLQEITHQETLALTKAVNQGPWTIEQKTKLVMTFDALKASATSTKKQKEKNMTQKCLWFENMMPAEKMAQLRNMSMSRLTRAQVIAGCGRDINLISPCENTKFRMVSILFWGEMFSDKYNEPITQNDVFEWMDKIGTFLKVKSTTRSTATTLPFLEEYPVTAELLPEEIKATFGGNLPPELKIDALDTILADKKKRGRTDRASRSTTDQTDPPWMKSLPKELRDQARRDICGVKQEPNNARVKVAPEQKPDLIEPTADDKIALLAARVKEEQLLREHFGQRAKLEIDDKSKVEPKVESNVEPEDESEVKPKIESGASNALDDMEIQMAATSRERMLCKATARTLKRPACFMATSDATDAKKRPSADIKN